MANIDEETVAGFGAEWQRFNHHETEEAEFQQIFDSYFSLFPWDSLPREALQKGVGSCDIWSGCE